jgi:hypothetical protein
MKPTIIPASLAERRAHPGPIQALGRRVLLGHLQHLPEGQLTLVEEDATHVFGQAQAGSGLATTIEVRHPQFWADAAFGGTVGAGESYIRGDWNCSDLTALVRLMVVNRDVMESMDSGFAIVTAPLRRILHWLNHNTHEGSRRNIAAHYDLGNDFFRAVARRDDGLLVGIFERPHRRCTRRSWPGSTRLPQARPQAGRTTGGNRHRLGRARAARGAALRLPKSPPPRSRANSTNCRRAWPAPGCMTASRCCWRTIRDLRRPVRQAGVDRDDRGYRSPLSSHLLPPSVADC